MYSASHVRFEMRCVTRAISSRGQTARSRMCVTTLAQPPQSEVI
jgi:hypothetical protein